MCVWGYDFSSRAHKQGINITPLTQGYLNKPWSLFHLFATWDPVGNFIPNLTFLDLWHLAHPRILPGIQQLNSLPVA